MKITILALLISVSGYSQIVFDMESKPTDFTKAPNYLLVYKEKDKYSQQSGMNVWYEDRIFLRNEVFETIEQLLAFINSSNWGNSKEVRVMPKNIIGVWDLNTASKIQLTLIEEKKVREKEVVVEKIEWVERNYVLKND